MKPRHFALPAVLCLLAALGLACGGGTAPDAPPADPPTDAPAPKDNVVVVPVEDDGQEHFCCEYTENGQQKLALLPSPRACRARFADKDARWVEGPQCLPCCCQIPLSPTDPSQGVKHELTVPGECAGRGTCVSSTVPECFQGPPEGDEPEGDEPEEGREGKGGKGKGGKGGKSPANPPDRERDHFTPKPRPRPG